MTPHRSTIPLAFAILAFVSTIALSATTSFAEPPAAPPGADDDDATGDDPADPDSASPGDPADPDPADPDPAAEPDAEPDPAAEPAPAASPSSTPAASRPESRTITGNGTATVSGGTVTATVTAKKPADPCGAKKALAESWHLDITAAPECKLSCEEGGKNCWSEDYEHGRAWRWHESDKGEHPPASLRWSKTEEAYVSKGLFAAIDASNTMADLRGRLAEAETLAAEAKSLAESKADKTVVEAIEGRLTTAEASLQSLDTRQKDDVTRLQEQIDDIVTDTADMLVRTRKLEGRADTNDQVDSAQTVLIADEMTQPQPFSGVAGGIQTDGTGAAEQGFERDGTDYYYVDPGAVKGVAMLDLGVCRKYVLSWTAYDYDGVRYPVLTPNHSCLTVSVGGGAGLDTGFGLLGFGSVGPEWRVEDYFSVGFHVGAQLAGHGMANGDSISGSAEGTFGARFRIRFTASGPSAMVPNLLVDIGGKGGINWRDQGMHQFGMGGAYLRVVFGASTEATIPEHVLQAGRTLGLIY